MSIPHTKNESVFTEKQGQYLAFVYYYTKINGIPPAQKDIQNFFKVTPPTVHNMIVLLEEKKLLTRKPNLPRSIQINISPKKLPILI